jgi:hypothetical protein
VTLTARLAGMAGLTLPIVMMMTRGLRGRRVRMMGLPFAAELSGGPIPTFRALWGMVVMLGRVVGNAGPVFLAP